MKIYLSIFIAITLVAALACAKLLCDYKTEKKLTKELEERLRRLREENRKLEEDEENDI